MERAEQSIVVGVDGSNSSAQAAVWAAAEAVRLAAPLHLVLVNNEPDRESHAKEVVHDISNSCRQIAGELEITEEVRSGHPAGELVHRSAAARLIVVGSRGQGAFRTTLLGSTSTAVATHASCPVVVVPGTELPQSGPVVVGIDGSTESHHAIHFAFDAAMRFNSELVAVHAFPDASFIPGPYDHPDRDELLASARSSLEAQVSPWAEDFPEVVVHLVVSNIPPVQALRDAARQAQLLVVGHRGTGGFTGLLLGSIARGALNHALCPVAVVPG
ncbi:universal stress protein [Saccharopolyspora rhizosphaerae]|uniref:Universal stress protein n=1 Tax=Saccharopolyspora rhizosphaerae TaxID=2492662 RepID=A0A3R8VBJ6_9PSEU|nr:universal stress protein [Saccharopolyspora rhizosphaerae]RRO14084.1 universal stress protein [Saccharopolyspora rhizosphaerae]